MPTPVLVNSRTAIPVQADRMTALDRQITRLGAQIALGERFTTPSEDPAAANRAALLERLDQRLQADQRAIARAGARLGLAEPQAAAAEASLTRARELALLAANGTASEEDRQVYAREVDVIARQLLDAANARDESGRYLFAGSRDAQPAFALQTDGSVLWQGLDSASGAEAAGIANAAPPAGPLLFGAGDGSAFAAVAALAEALVEPDAELRRTGLDTAITALEAASNRLLDGRARIGAAMARLDQETDRLADARLQAAEALAGAKGLDVTAALAQLEALKTTLEAARGVFVRINDGTLFDRLG